MDVSENETLILQKALMGYQKMIRIYFVQHYIYINLVDVLLFFKSSYSDCEEKNQNNPKKVKLDSSPRRQTERTRHPAAPLAADKRML